MNAKAKTPEKKTSSVEDNQAIVSFLEEAKWLCQQAQELRGEEHLFYCEQGYPVELLSIVEKAIEEAKRDFEPKAPGELPSGNKFVVVASANVEGIQT